MSATVTATAPEIETASSSTEPMLFAPELRAALPELQDALREQQQTQRARLATADGTAYTTSYLPGHEERMNARLDGIRRLLEETEVAINRIEDGTYGRCPGCAQQISLVRLEILPHARCCMSCQQRQDTWRR